MSETETNLFTRITNLEEIASLQEVLICGSNANNIYVMAVQNTSSNNRASVLGSLNSENLLIYNDTMLLLKVTYNSQDDTILFSYDVQYSSESTVTYYLCGVEGNNNRLRTTDTLNANCYFRARFEREGILKLTCANENITHNVMQLNPQNLAFACYLPTFVGIEVDLYKRYEEPLPPEPPVPPEPVIPTKHVGQYHFIDPLFFYEAILEFGTWFDWYPCSEAPTIDDMGRLINKYDHKDIFGSLQPQEGSIEFNVNGNTHKLKYKFYCMSKYRINFDDFIYDANKRRYLHVDEVHDYDEAGVREVSLTMINLTDYRDFEDYLKYLDGRKQI